MSAFCVFGVSMSDCIKAARKKVKTYTEGDRKERIDLPMEEWNRQVGEYAAALFETARARQISPAFDAPEFCRDWIAVGQKTKQISRPLIMCKRPKIDKKGKPILRKGGQPLIGWTPFSQGGAA